MLAVNSADLLINLDLLAAITFKAADYNVHFLELPIAQESG